MKKKVLVVDDDPFARKVLGKFLRSFPCIVMEAGDGLEALALIATEEPELVFLDVKMPVMDGLQTLREIRSSAAYAQLPVVSVSAATERNTVTKLIDLGISGFLVKPLKPDETYRRLDALFRSLRTLAPSPAGVASGVQATSRQKLLLIEQDPNFREFARPLLDTHFEVLEATTGAVGWRMFVEQEPSIVCMGENLQLLSTESLLGMIRAAEGRKPPRLFLLSEDVERDGQEAGWDGLLRKSFVPDVFCREIRATLLASESVSAQIASLARNTLEGELITAAQQTLGVLTSREVTTLAETAVGELPWTIQATSRLVAADHSVTVLVGLCIGETDAETLGSKILGQPTSLEEGAREAVTELVSTIAGRVCASLAGRGFPLEQQPPSVEAAATSLREDWELAVPFQTCADERFFVSLWVLDGETPRRASSPPVAA